MLPVCLDSKKDTLHPTIHDTIRQNLIFNLSQRRNINHAALQSSFYFRFFIRRQESHTIDYSEFIRRPPLGLSLASFDASRSFWPLFFVLSKCSGCMVRTLARAKSVQEFFMVERRDLPRLPRGTDSLKSGDLQALSCWYYLYFQLPITQVQLLISFRKIKTFVPTKCSTTSIRKPSSIILVTHFKQDSLNTVWTTIPFQPFFWHGFLTFHTRDIHSFLVHPQFLRSWSSDQGPTLTVLGASPSVFQPDGKNLSRAWSATEDVTCGCSLSTGECQES